jgi:putative aldouronate transport system permease protein
MAKPVVSVKPRSKLQIARERWRIYAMMLPGLVILILFAYLPMLGLTMCFNDYNPILGIKGFWQSEWVGLKWFEKFITSFYFERLMRNTLLINLAKLGFGFWVPILFALLLNEETNQKLKKTVQTVSYMPYFISWVTVMAMMEALFSPTIGMVNNIRTALGAAPIYFMGKSEYFYPMIVGSSIWKSFGWSSIIYLAAMSGISEEMYEAAELDGCSHMQRAWYITLPTIRPLIVMMLLLNIGGLLGSDFQQIFTYIGSNSSLYEVGDVIATYVYRVGLSGLQLSFGAAVGLFTGVISLILLGGGNFLAKRLGEEGLF